MVHSAEDWIQGKPRDLREIVLTLRDVILREAPGVMESVLWEALSYHRPEIGGRIKGSVCMIVVREGNLRLDFVHGVRMRDPNHLLQGDLRSKRYVPIESVRDALRPTVAALIREADSIIPVSGRLC